MMHIIDRFLIHLFASGGISLAAIFALRMAQRRLRCGWLPTQLLGQCSAVAIVVFTVAVLREAYDVARGQSLAKAVCDYASWAGGCGCSAWAIIRISKL